MSKRWASVVALAAAAIMLAGCRAPGPESSLSTLATTDAAASAHTDTAAFRSVVDGDTIETSAGTVRLIGIDTPERGECGYPEASASIGRLLASGDEVVLTLPPGQNDTDSYGRLIRYVTTADGHDLSLRQLEAGHAVARYDSRDGYPAHPNEAAYRAAQIAQQAPSGAVITVECAQGAPSPSPVSLGKRWWEQYTSCARLKKNSVGDPTGPFAEVNPSESEIYDWFANRTGNNGDGDGDGLACE